MLNDRFDGRGRLCPKRFNLDPATKLVFRCIADPRSHVHDTAWNLAPQINENLSGAIKEIRISHGCVRVIKPAPAKQVLSGRGDLANLLSDLGGLCGSDQIPGNR